MKQSTLLSEGLEGDVADQWQERNKRRGDCDKLGLPPRNLLLALPAFGQLMQHTQHSRRLAPQTSMRFPFPHFTIIDESIICEALSTCQVDAHKLTPTQIIRRQRQGGPTTDIYEKRTSNEEQRKQPRRTERNYTLLMIHRQHLSFPFSSRRQSRW